MGGYGNERTDVRQDEKDDTDLQLGDAGRFPVYHCRFLFWGRNGNETFRQYKTVYEQTLTSSIKLD
jgi:hypothetical protein